MLNRIFVTGVALLHLLAINACLTSFAAPEPPVPTIDDDSLKPASSSLQLLTPTTTTPWSGRLFPNIPVGNVQYLSRFIQSYNRRLPIQAVVMMAEAILGMSQNFGVDFRLLTGVMAVESSFRSDAVSSSGAIGLGQLKPKTAEWLGVSNPFDPLENIAGTAKYIRFLVERYNGNLDAAISAYFQGQGFVDRNGITQPCRLYLTKVNGVISKM